MTKWSTRKRGRKVFFVDAFYELDCVTEGKTTLVVASRRQAKNAVRYIRARCLQFHGSTIRPARQGDLFFTGWTVNRRAYPPELCPAHGEAGA